MRARPQLWITAFLIAFVLNLLWENLHAVLYAHYGGGPITEPLLIFMSIKDALLILTLIAAIKVIPNAAKYPWLIFLCGIVTAVVIESHALATGRWAYTQAMPIIPYLGTGLSPTVQLGLLGYISYRATFDRSM